MIIKYEGYWRSSEDEKNSDLPWPRPSDTKCSSDFIDKLKYVLSHSVEGKRYRGYSNCRLCGGLNGTREYLPMINEVRYVVPEGYLHYLEDHNVHPSEDFKSFINQF